MIRPWGFVQEGNWSTIGEAGARIAYQVSICAAAWIDNTAKPDQVIKPRNMSAKAQRRRQIRAHNLARFRLKCFATPP